MSEFVHKPVEIAREFLRTNFSDANFTGLRESNPPYNLNLIANLTWHNMQRVSPTERAKFLAETPIPFVALVIAQFESGLTEEEERFTLHNSAARYALQIGTELVSHQLIGRLHYGTLDLLREPKAKTPRNTTEYLAELEAQQQRLQTLQADLVTKV